MACLETSLQAQHFCVSVACSGLHAGAKVRILMPLWAAGLVGRGWSTGRGLTLASSRPPELGGQARFGVKVMGPAHPAAAEPGR